MIIPVTIIIKTWFRTEVVVLKFCDLILNRSFQLTSVSRDVVMLQFDRKASITMDGSVTMGVEGQYSATFSKPGNV